MLRKFTFKWLLSPWKMSCILCATALVACLPIFFPLSSQAETQHAIRSVCGWFILLSFVLSCVLVTYSSVLFFLKMRNLRAIGQIGAYLTVWSAGALIFMQLAIEANMPPPYPVEVTRKSEKKGIVHEASDQLMGPSTLCTLLTITEADEQNPTLQVAPNLLALEKEHPEIFEQYLATAPKWSHTAADDTFYSKPGHVVLVTPTSGGIPGTVHVAFRTVAAGEPLPDGYLLIKPGAPKPSPVEEDKTQIPDLALDLGGKRYLLLAWRGASNRDKAFAAINAAIREIDTQFAPLVNEPTPQCIQELVRGNEYIYGSEPKLLLAEPSSQFGIYQAEIYANPGREGTIMLVIRDRATKQPLQIFSHAARYSSNKEQLFRHDIPLALHDKDGSRRTNAHANVFDENAPFFAISLGESHRYFEITAEVHFSPAGSMGEHTELLLERHYNVQAYEKQEEALPQAPTIPLNDLPVTVPEIEEANTAN